MTSPLEEGVLRDLYGNYLTALDPTDERLRTGIRWALDSGLPGLPLRQVPPGLVADDHLVEYADEIGRPINPRSWHRIVESVDTRDALAVAEVAYVRGELALSQRANRRAADDPDPQVAAAGSYRLSVVLHQHGDLDGAEVAMRRADELGHPSAAFNLGTLLHDRGDLAGAEAAYRRAYERGHDRALTNLGALLLDRGDIPGALDCFRRAAERGDALAREILDTQFG